MRQWKRIKIEDIGSLSNGINFDKSSYVAGAKLIGVSDFKDRLYPDYDNLQQVSIDAVKEGDYLKKGDIVFVRSNGNKNLVGRCMIIDKNLPVTYSGFCIRLRIKDTAKYNPLFFAYLFKSTDFRNSMANNAVGANIQNLNQKRLGGYEPLVPDYRTQLHIASILSKYDTLIENYQQQIKLLEEAAQRLYKEWFVDLHFPGYENTKIVDGVPEGWEKTVLSKIAEFRRGKTVVKKEITVGSIPVVAGGLTPAYYFNKANTENRVITISGSGANAGFTKLYYQRVWASDCSFVDTSMTEHLYFVYCFMKANKINIDNLQKGAAQPHVYAKDINNLQIIIPDHNILSQFEAKVANAFERIAILKSQLRLLTEARDRLLPKLMSGEIEV
jgi:type I restriction enzyme S subunit